MEGGRARPNGVFIMWVLWGVADCFSADLSTYLPIYLPPRTSTILEADNCYAWNILESPGMQACNNVEDPLGPDIFALKIASVDIDGFAFVTLQLKGMN